MKKQAILFRSARSESNEIDTKYEKLNEWWYPFRTLIIKVD